ncbi:hypothetical protein jhhlp_004544 [Lomentospora prolificans]|uniref:2-(3-amino-3-carboxypropyl)histidine synthase subunit 2 n=1 Tax=Lomentospora prolificans TaxID=41688 RepID=A0A2N3NBY4_9PEZI|nr:hypothetical protein jhhlp_004544 [Lomentospora prolificans]
MSDLAAAPVLSTPAENVLEFSPAVPENAPAPRRPDDELRSIYEIERTAREIRDGGWERVALQFPDSMLSDVPWVFGALSDALESAAHDAGKKTRLYVLADTSYSACCVDEIAAEHANAQVVVHYGRSCLSPTARLPVIYVFTRYPLDHELVLGDFEATYPDKEADLVVIADVTYQDHVEPICSALRSRGYTNLLSTAVIHDPSGTIPNRKLVSPTSQDVSSVDLKTYSAFHISTPPTSLLLALHSRLLTLHIHPTSSSDDAPTNTAALLRRRFARVLSLAGAGTIGILVNTLSVANYLSSIEALRKRIAKAGKKSYTVVVGKLNPAKLANFAEIEGWVVVGCWESGLVEDDRSYFMPVVTPFELEVAMMDEDERIWGGEWWGGIEGLKIDDEEPKENETETTNTEEETIEDVEGGVEGDESAPPEFDLRTGKLISHSRPMRGAARAPLSPSSPAAINGAPPLSSSNINGAALIKKETGGELATINGIVSTGAEFLRSRRTWQGLGTDFDNEESTVIEEGRRGVARGYAVGEEPSRT